MLGVNDSVLEFASGTSASLPARRPKRYDPGSLGHFCGFKDGIKGVRAATAATTSERGESSGLLEVIESDSSSCVHRWEPRGSWWRRRWWPRR